MNATARGPWAVRPGRSLVWAPAWDDGEVALVFDAHSGDYWVLSAPAAALLRRLNGDAEPGSGPPDDAELLTELQTCGLVAPVG